ncbi:MAG: hypothetical protein Unbinned1446contig1001_14 [Prokaryotic dsDNA virus sp.]|nr:MAG: hypothetical protein Unbinned1446contig1001_14 [Prokaryotic dsDNA virus sp.]
MVRFLILCVLLAGCKTTAFSPHTSETTTQRLVDAAESEPLTVLSVTGGLCLLAGMVLLVVTSGRKGWYPVIGGLLLVVLNYVVARYSHYLFAPAIVFTGMISAAWTYKTIKQILLEKKSK